MGVYFSIINNISELYISRTLDPIKKWYIKHLAHPFSALYKPMQNVMATVALLESRRNKPLQTSCEKHLKALIFFHLEDHSSAQHLLQTLEEDDCARSEIAPKGGINKEQFLRGHQYQRTRTISLCL